MELKTEIHVVYINMQYNCVIFIWQILRNNNHYIELFTKMVSVLQDQQVTVLQDD